MQVIQHPAETIRTALVSSRCDLTDRYHKYSREERRLLEECLCLGDGSLFRPITEPQDFQSFYSNPYRSKPIKGHSTIYLQIIGRWSGAKITQTYVRWLRDYCQAFYYWLVVKLLPPVTVAATDCAFRINSSSHNLQIHAGERNQLTTPDAFGIMGITAVWSACYSNKNDTLTEHFLSAGMGVFSFARYDDNFYIRSYSDLWPCLEMDCYWFRLIPYIYAYPSSVWFQMVTHEIGHIFGVKYCQWMQCVIQGSNHLEHSDRRPLDLCLCLRKSRVLNTFQTHCISRLSQTLLRWIEKGGTANSEPYCPKPTLPFQTFRQWLRRCLEILDEVLEWSHSGNVYDL
uniref:Archaemetzincin-2 n=1 Tax=Oncorhynchus tshawytscha TaxID=74940 RepID=A0A8C8M0Q4_ONCTS